MDKRQEITETANRKTGMQLLDWSSLQEVCLNKDDLIRKLLNLFVTQVPLWETELRQAVDAADPLKLREVCHTIKGATAAIKAAACYQFLDELHHMARDGNLANAQSCLDKVIAVMTDTQALFQQILQE